MNFFTSANSLVDKANFRIFLNHIFIYNAIFRVYMGPISLSGLGEGFKTLRVGSVGTPIGTYTLSAAYRTVDNLHVSQQQMLVCCSLHFWFNLTLYIYTFLHYMFLICVFADHPKQLCPLNYVMIILV